MRLLGALGLLAPVAFVSLWIAMPTAFQSWVDDGSRSIVASIAAGSLGVSLTAGLVFLYVRLRFRRLINAAEGLAGGRLDVDLGTKPGAHGLECRLGRAIDAIAVALVETTNAATFDKLTGVNNRQALLGALVSEVERASRYGRPLSVAFVDIDHFKTVNDTYGHAVGDAVLQRIADVILNHSRADDLVARYGGEEFLFAFTNHGRKSAWAVCERLRRSIAAEDWATFGEGFVVTVSIGLAESVDNDTVESLTARADRQLYLAKASGRNRTRQSEPGIAVAGPDRKTLDPEHG